jgi:hypothetical protein
LHSHLCLSSFTSSKQLVASTFYVCHRSWRLEHDLQCWNILPTLPQSSNLSVESNIWLKCKLSLLDISSNMRQQCRYLSDIFCRPYMSNDTCTKWNTLQDRLQASSEWEGVVCGEGYRILGYV